MAKESLGRDITGAVDFSLPQMQLGKGVTLTANVEQNFITPPNYNRIFFSYSPGSSVYVAIDDTAAVFGATIADTTSELNPSIRQINIKGGQTISVISPATASVGFRLDIGSPGVGG